MNKFFSDFASKFVAAVCLLTLGLFGFSAKAGWTVDDWSTLDELPQELRYYVDGTISKNPAYNPNIEVTDPFGGTNINYCEGPYIECDYFSFDGRLYLDETLVNAGGDHYISIDLSKVPAASRENYTVGIPQGYILVDGVPNDNFIMAYFSVEKAAGEKGLHSNPGLRPSPAVDMSKITLEWDDYDPAEVNGDLSGNQWWDPEWGAIQLTGPNGLDKKILPNDITLEGSPKFGEGYRRIVIDLGDTYTTEGNYELYIPNGTFFFFDSQGNSVMNSTLGLEYVVRPYRISPAAMEEVTEELEGIVIYGDGITVVNPNNVPTFTAKTINPESLTGAMKDIPAPEFGEYVAEEGKVTIKFKQPYAPDTDTYAQVNFSVPTGTFAFNGVTYTKGTIGYGDVYYIHRGLVPYATSQPATDKPLGKFDVVYLTWGDETTLSDINTRNKVTLDTPNQKGMDVTKYLSLRHIADLDEGGLVDGGGNKASELVLDLSTIAFTAAGEYTLTLPAGVVTVGGYNSGNRAQTLTYNVTPATLDAEYTIGGDQQPGDVQSIGNIDIAFNGNVAYIDEFADFSFVRNGVSIDADPNYRVVFGANDANNGVAIYVEKFVAAVEETDSDTWEKTNLTDGGTYELVIPAYTMLFDVNGTQVFYDKEIRAEYVITEAGYMKAGVALDVNTNRRLPRYVKELQGLGILLSFEPEKLQPCDDIEDLEVLLYIEGSDEPIITKLAIVPAEISEDTDIGDIESQSGKRNAKITVTPGTATGLSIKYDEKWPFESIVGVPYGYTGLLRFEVPEGLVKNANGDINQAQVVEVTIAPETEVEPTESNGAENGIEAPAVTVDALGQILIDWGDDYVLSFTGGETVTLRCPGEEDPIIVNLVDAGKVSVSGKYLVAQASEYSKLYGYGAYTLIVRSGSVLLKNPEGTWVNQDLYYNYVIEAPKYYLDGPIFVDGTTRKEMTQEGNILSLTGVNVHPQNFSVKQLSGENVIVNYGPVGAPDIINFGEYQGEANDRQWVFSAVEFGNETRTRVVDITFDLSTLKLNIAAAPEVPEATSSIPDGYFGSWIGDDHTAINWNYQNIELVNDESIVLTLDGENISNPLSFELSYVIDGTGKEDNPNIDSGDGDGEDDEEAVNVLTVKWGGFLFDAGTYVLTIPEGAVNVLCDGKWLPNKMTTFTWYVVNLSETTIEPTITVNGKNSVSIDWNNLPIKENEDDFQIFLEDPDFLFRLGETVSIVDNKLVLDISGLNLSEGNYKISLAPHSVYVDESGTGNFSPTTNSQLKVSQWKYIDLYILADMEVHLGDDSFAQSGTVDHEEGEIKISSMNDDVIIYVNAPANATVYYQHQITEGRNVKALAALEGEWETAVNNNDGTHSITVPNETKGVITVYYELNGGAVEPLTYNYEAVREYSTGVSFIGADADGMWRVYNLNGVNLLNTRDASDLNLLDSGLYIINGKKVIIRK